MSKKNQEQNKISELLSKLKATFPELDKKGAEKKKVEEADTGDVEFQQKLASMLGQASAPKKAKKKQASKPAEAPVEDPVEEPIDEPAEKMAEEIAPPEAPTPQREETPPKPRPKSSKAKKKAEATPRPTKEALEPSPGEATPELPPTPPAPIPEEPAEEPPMAMSVPSEEPPVSPVQEVPQTPPPTVEEVPLPQAEEAPLPAEPIEPPRIHKEPVPSISPVQEPSPTPQKTASPVGKKGAEPIVIRPPKTNLPKQESIVIRPRTVEKTVPVPQKVTETKEKQSPIRIGKEATARVSTPTPTRESTPPTKKESTAPRAAAATAPAASGKPSSKRPNVTLPPKKEDRFSRPAPQPLPPPEDTELLDEEMEENLSEEVYVSPAVKKEATSPAKGKTPPTARPVMTPAEEICQKAGLSEEDLDLLFDLGYDTELRTLVGNENLKILKSQHLQKLREKEKGSYPTAFGYRGKEYVGSTDRAGVLAAFSRDRKRLILRVALTALCSLLLLFVEPTNALGAYGDQIRAISPLILPILSILLLLGAAALSYKQCLAGFRAWLRMAPTPYSVCGVLLLLTLVYDGIALGLPLPSLLVNFLSSLSLLSLCLCDVFRISAQMRSFRILSREGEKYVLEESAPRKQKMRQGTKIVKLIHTGDGNPQYRVSAAKDTTGFFRRCNFMDDAARPFTVLIAAMLAVPFLLAFAGALLLQEASSVISLCIIALLACTPLAAVVGYVYPLFRAGRLLAFYGCTLVGEESVEEYNRPKTVIFEDKDMFLTEKCTEIVIRENDDFQNDIKLASALFRKIGSTLDPIGQACSKQTADIPVTLVRITDAGVEATVGKCHVLAGSAAFLKKGGVRIPKESTDRVTRRTPNVSLMHVAIDGTLKLSYEIEYTCKTSFEQMAQHLAECSTTLAIRSYDPNLNDGFLQSSRSPKAIPIRVIKPGRYEENTTQPLCDTGAVSTEDPAQLVGVLLAANGVAKLRRFSWRMQLIASILGLASLLLLTWLGKTAAVGPWQILLYQFFWTLVTLIACHAELTDKKLHLKK